ncbi:hypothetical protein FRC19_001205, partial [Serendipita sp. 401]
NQMNVPLDAKNAQPDSPGSEMWIGINALFMVAPTQRLIIVSGVTNALFEVMPEGDISKRARAAMKCTRPQRRQRGLPD